MVWLTRNRRNIQRDRKKGKKIKQSHYFIYSCRGMTVEQIMKHKRNHWGAENSLHWVLDMAFREDVSRAIQQKTLMFCVKLTLIY
jgi:predicted transposase YbfD/YdcC